eukprot:CAMPEP_0172590610 /NCGR_PEP_ID=MMETSP1068-20121228/9156_1 /TAXON_ID=35684 /ORGANISM="Pseudopedinella elastica, Strain CCMP716" /LENGTH=117 /DNA_ID=CAMNT_0013386567 /DNA_START=90 /DNA_END=439 /DNA_ORIENTATION=+
MASPMMVAGFGKPAVKSGGGAAAATRRVQRWLSDPEAGAAAGVETCTWAADAGGILKVEEVECDVPGCAPIETVLYFLAQGRNQFVKVLKPIAEVTAQEISGALGELRRLVDGGGDG